MSTKLILITGATGKQGRALISALRPTADDTQANSFHILALTRTADSPAATELSQEKHVDVVEGNLDDGQSVRKVFDDAKKRKEGGVWGVFCVLAFPGLGVNADGEEKQGKMLADLALEFGVSSFVFSSAERGGESYDDRLTLDRLAKVRIERHIRALGSKGLRWTILRPGWFMENFEGTIGSITVGVLKAGLKPTTTVQLIAVDDIGHVAAGVFRAPESYASKVLVVVGDMCTTKQMEEAYRTATGRSMPSIPKFLGRLIISINGHTQHLIQDLERVHLARIDPENEEIAMQTAAAKEAYPGLTSFGTWAAQRKLKGKEAKREKNWNQVSMGRLLTGKL
ncbi:putative nmrA-like family protein [Lyophyllum shimeji]|uniref:NmrA-like family protein n=1 Tax=Lyophyllum shimeji TaxID=47721 RepID=A0A9P3UTV7_LYOSH|nr:putative nmrA-like family protein [Lyophyllum shimeji]